MLARIWEITVILLTAIAPRTFYLKQTLFSHNGAPCPKGWCNDAYCGADSPFMEHSLSCQALKEWCSMHCLCVTGSNSRPEKTTWLNLGAPVTSMGACGSPDTRPLSLSRITKHQLFQAATLCLELYCWVVMHRNSRTCQFNQQSTAKALFNLGYILKHIYWVLKRLQFK